jgi:hypothetical protein
VWGELIFTKNENMQDSFFDELSQLRQEYVERVLPSLIPGVSKDIMGMSRFNSSSRKIDISLSSDALVGTSYDPKKSRFVHFTSLRSLQSIVNENAIRLYSLQNVNDPNEFNFYVSELEIVNRSIDNLKTNTFILSLCEAGVLKSENILNLWRFYGDGGLGVAIEFEIEIPLSPFRNYFLGKILYRKPKIGSFKRRNAKFEKKNKVTMDFSEIVRIPACFHKNPYYKAEEEVRLMLVDDHGESSAKHDHKQNHFRRDFNSRPELVTYHRLELGQKSSLHDPKITIKRIELGFKHSRDFFIDFRIHLIDTFVSMTKAGIWKDDIPEIEPSPLGNIYR